MRTDGELDAVLACLLAVDAESCGDARTRPHAQHAGCVDEDRSAHRETRHRQRRQVFSGRGFTDRGRRKIEKPHREFLVGEVWPRRDGAAPWIRRQPISARVPTLGGAGAVNHVWAGRLNACAPAIVHERGGAERLPAKQQENHDERAARTKRLGRQPEEQREQQAQNQRIWRVVERGAVKKASDP